MIKYEIDDAQTGETAVHYDSALGYDTTLCGVAMEVDVNAASSEPRQTNRRVTCDQCIANYSHTSNLSYKTEDKPVLIDYYVYMGNIGRYGS